MGGWILDGMREARRGVKNLGLLDHVVKRIFNYINIICSAIQLVFCQQSLKTAHLSPKNCFFNFSIFCFTLMIYIQKFLLVGWSPGSMKR